MNPSGKRRKLDQVCVIHNTNSNSEQFIYLNERTFKKLLTTREIRLKEPVGSALRMADICEQIPSEITNIHGYHRDCYQRFTMNLSRISNKHQEKCPDTEVARTSRKRALDSDKVIFKPDCIFCQKVGYKKCKVKGVWTTESTSKFEYEGGMNIKKIAEERHDERLLTRIRGFDLFACEAHFHRSCRKNYTRDPAHWLSSSEEQKKEQTNLEEAHKEAFLCVFNLVERDIIGQKKVLRLNDIRQLYVDEIASTPYANPNYRSENLKNSLKKKFPNSLIFVKLVKQGKFSSDLVASADTDIALAIQYAYKLGTTDQVKECAIFIRNDISEAFENENSIQWPPTAQYLTDANPNIPESLKKFLAILFTGSISNLSTKVLRHIESISQDICRAVTHGQWKLPKHILISMTIRHWFRSAELTNLLNRLGHCETYSFTLELETALAMAVENTSSLLSPQIVRHPDVPSVFHSDFDNFDQLLNDLTGMGSVHTAHGIMMQDFCIEGEENIGGFRPVIPSLEKSGRRSLQLESQSILPECYVTQRKSPNYKVTVSEVPGSAVVFSDDTLKGLVWIIARYLSCTNGQDLPGWAGYISLFGKKPSNLTTIDYYPVINQPITDYKTVQECLRYSEEGAQEVGQKYCITTFDLGVCMKAYPLIWNQPNKYKNHIIMIGTFHVICAYLKMLGKKMEGSGLSDVLLESGMVGSGSISGVITGKHYNRAITCHKTLLEALERLLFEEFCVVEKGESRPFESIPVDSLNILHAFIDSPCVSTLNSVLSDNSLRGHVDEFLSFREDVRNGRLGKTAQFWMSYLDHVWIVLQLLKAVKTNDFLLYSRCLFLMPDLFFSFGGQNYARYLSFFSVFLANLDESHPGATDLLKRGAISVARSFIPGNRCAVDKTIEETFMRQSKSHGGAGGGSAGLSGLLNNYDSYQRWVRAAHERAQFVQTTLAFADMLPDTVTGSTHRDLRATEICRGETYVVTAAETVLGFVNPFDTEDKTKLYCISSGAAANQDVEADILKAEAIGKREKERFIKERLEKNDNFFQPIKRLNLKTFASMIKTTKIKSSNNKVLEYKQQSNIAFQLLVRSQCEDLRLNLKELMAYPLTPVPYSIATPDGILNKTDKSKGYHFLIKDIADIQVVPSDAKTLVIQDGNAVFYYLKELPPTFKGICEKIFDISVRSSDTVFSTDMYFENSVKAMERVRRGTGEKLIVKGPNVRKPADWKSFLTNEENKKQLINLLIDVWSSDSMAVKLQSKRVIAVCGENAFQLFSEDGQSVIKTEVDDLCSSQEETDSRVILYCLYGLRQGYEYVRIKSPDTDIFFISLHYALTMPAITILFDTGTGNNKRLINITRLAENYGQQYCTALMCLHAFTRCDSTSAFKGVGKVKPIKAMQKSPTFQNALSKLGDSWEVTPQLLDELESFTCVLYGKPRFTSVNDVRHNNIRVKCVSTSTNAFDSKRNVDISMLPPCKKTLEQHIRRVNYQVGIWKYAHVAKPNIPLPSNGHGWHLVDGLLEPRWFEGDFVPQRLADVLQRETEDNQEDSSDDEMTDDEFGDVLYSLYDSDAAESEDED